MPRLTTLLRGALGAAVALASAASAHHTAVAETEPEHTIRFAYYGGTDLQRDYEHATAFAFKSVVETKSAGKIEVKLYPGGVLGTAEEVVESMIENRIQMGLPTEGVLTRWMPKLSSFAIPYLYNDINVAREMFQGEFGEKYRQMILDEVGVRILDIGEVGGLLAFTTNKRPVPNPEDIAGLKIRTLAHDGYIAFLKELGASPTPMPFAEVYTSMQTGVIDGHFNPISAVVSFKIYEVQEHLTLTEHLYGPMYIAVSEEFFQELDSNEQRILYEAAKQARNVNYGVTTLTEASGLSLLADKGMNIVPLTLEQKAEYRGKTEQALKDVYAEKFGSEWVEEILAAAEAAEQRVYD